MILHKASSCNNEKYYWDSTFYVVTIVCAPAWNEEQHKLVQ